MRQQRPAKAPTLEPPFHSANPVRMGVVLEVDTIACLIRKKTPVLLLYFNCHTGSSIKHPYHTAVCKGSSSYLSNTTKGDKKKISGPSHQHPTLILQTGPGHDPSPNLSASAVCDFEKKKRYPVLSGARTVAAKKQITSYVHALARNLPKPSLSNGHFPHRMPTAHRDGGEGGTES